MKREAWSTEYWTDSRSDCVGCAPQMKLRIISDTHGNIHALKRVLADPAGADAELTICLGDTVGYGAFPSECIRLIRETCGIVVAGNHDSGTAGGVPLKHFNSAGETAIRWIRPRMSSEELEWLAGLPLHATHGELFLCHSDPAHPAGWVYIRNASQAERAIRARSEQISLIGHTHMPGCWIRGGGFSEEPSGDMSNTGILNCGSVGQPRDGNPRAAYAILDTEEGTWRHVRVEYDIKAAANAILDAGLPSILAERLYIGR